MTLGPKFTGVSRSVAAMMVLAILPLLGVAGCVGNGGQAATVTPDQESGGVESGGGGDRLRLEIRRMIGAGRDRVFPALVNISVVTLRYRGGIEQKGQGVGSGTIISPDGYVVTNYHVTSHGKKFTCTLADKQEIGATLVGEDPLTDLAVLKLNLAELKAPAPKLPVAQWGDSDQLEIGDYVLAMGSPFALSRSVTLGIVSNTQRVFDRGPGGDGSDMELEPGQSTGLFTRWLQHDALINPGNSGGPLVNLQGQVVGVNELGGQGIGYAIPSNLARSVADSLIRRGEVERSWVGISLKPIERTGLQQGVLINSVVKGSPADAAGIRPGDVLLKIGSEPVTVRFPEEVPPLMKKVADLPIGARVAMTLLRGDAEVQTAIVTARFQRDVGAERSLRAWGLTVQQITPKMAQELRLDNAEGVLVSSIRAGGPADQAEPPLGEDDVIRAVGGQSIKELAGIVELYRQMSSAEKKPEKILVLFDRRGQNELTLLKPRNDKDDEPPPELAKAWIGVATQPVLRDLAQQLGRPEAAGGLGFRVTRVYPGTTAAQAGLKVGDIITALEGEKVIPRGMQDAGMFQVRVHRLQIGDPAKLTVLRDGNSLDLTVTLERTHVAPADAPHESNKDFELTVREVTFFDRDENRWGGETQGVLVRDVEPAGWAGLGGIRRGDLIQRIDRYDIKDLESYRQAMAAVAKAQPERVVVMVLRGVRTGFEYLEPEWKPAVAATQPSPTPKE